MDITSLKSMINSFIQFQMCIAIILITMIISTPSPSIFIKVDGDSNDLTERGSDLSSSLLENEEVFVENVKSNSISVIDLDDNQVIKNISVGKGPHGLAFSADGNLLYISNMKSNDISVVNTSSDKVISTIPVGLEPHQIVIKKPSIHIISKNTSTSPIYVEIADNPFEQSKGLMYRNNLDWNSGMLFVFDNERVQSFWMKNTLIPLDMIFIDKNHRIVDIKENTQPCKIQNCPSYISKQPAKYVLEVNAGYAKENYINIGDTLKW